MLSLLEGVGILVWVLANAIGILVFFSSPKLLAVYILLTNIPIVIDLPICLKELRKSSIVEENTTILLTSFECLIFGILNIIVMYFAMPPLIPLSVSLGLFAIVVGKVVIDYLIEEEELPAYKKIIGIIGGVVFLLTAAYIFIGPVIYCEKLHKEFDEKIKVQNITVDLKHVRVIPYETAIWRAEKALGKYGDIYVIGEPHIQLYNGELVWVAEIRFKTTLQALIYREAGVPGYVFLSAEKVEQPKFVEHRMIYVTSGVFDKKLERIIYWRYPEYILGEATLQIDPSGTPWYVVPLMRPTVAFTGLKIEKVAIVNPSTGEISIKDKGDLPKWISRIVDEKAIEDWLFWWGIGAHGPWNAIFIHKDVILPSGGLEVSVSKTGEIKIGAGKPDVYLVVVNNKTYWFTTLVPRGEQTTMVGYILVNARDPNDVVLCKSSGQYSDLGAARVLQQSPEVSKVMGLRVTQPILYHVCNKMVFIIPIITSSSEIKEIGLVDSETGKCFIGKDVEEIIAKYKEWLGLKNESVAKKEQVKFDDVIAKVVVYENSTIVEEILVRKGQKVEIIPIS